MEWITQHRIQEIRGLIRYTILIILALAAIVYMASFAQAITLDENHPKLISLLRFNETTSALIDAKDRSTWTYTAGTSPVNNHEKSVIDYGKNWTQTDASGSYYSSDYDYRNLTSKDNYTVCIFLNNHNDDADTYQLLFSNGDNTNGGGILIYVDPDHDIYIESGDTNDGYLSPATGCPKVPLGNYTAYCLKVNSTDDTGAFSRGFAYINGEMVCDAWFTTLDNTPITAYIGWQYSAVALPPQSLLDELAFFYPSLTDEEMREVYHNWTSDYVPPSPYPTVTIHSPLDGSIIHDNSLRLNFSFNLFSPNNCSAYADSGAGFQYLGSVIGGFQNITGCVNTSVNISSETGFWDIAAGAWRMENNFLDSSKSLKNGTGSGAYSFQESKGANETLNNSFYTFGGGYMHAGNNYGYDRLTPFSGSAWIKTSYQPTQVIMSKRAAAIGWQFYMTSSIRMTLYNSGTNYIIVSGNTNSSNNEWNHVAFTYDGSSLAAGIKLYVNGQPEALTTVADSLTSSIANSANFQVSGFNGASSLFYGYIDEVMLFNFTLSPTNITEIYNHGFNSSKITGVNMTENCTSTYINQTLNQTMNYSITTTFPADTRKNMTVYVNCRDGLSVNSSMNLIYYDNDFTQPLLGIIFPKPDGLAWNFSMYINFTSSETVSCSMNVSNFTLSSTTGYNQSWFENTLDNGYYHVNVSCYDLSNNNQSVKAIFTKDKQYPDIVIQNPPNAAMISNTGLLLIRVNMSDDQDLYNYNITASYFDTLSLETVILLNNYSIISPAKNYLFNKVYDTSSWPNETDITLSARVCDSHTKNDIKAAKKIEKKTDKLIFYFDDGVWVNITDQSPCRPVKTDSAKTKDRYSFEFEYDKACKSMDKEFTIHSNAQIDILENTLWPGHMVIAGKYWVDFDPGLDMTDSWPVVEKMGDDKAIVKIMSKKADSVRFNSIGELNCNIAYSVFRFEPVTPGMFELDFSDLSTILWIGILLILYLGLVIIGLYFESLLFGSMGAILGMFIGLFLSSASMFLTIFMVISNLGLLVLIARGQRP